MAYRHTATFIADWRAHSVALDRNAKVRILVAAEALERRSKMPGRRSGLLGYVGLAILRALLYRYHNSKSGLCCPSYASLQAHTGLCQSSIANGLARLERAGLVTIIRRLVRQRVERTSPLTGQPETYTGTTQASSLYSLHMPGAWCAHLPVPASKPSPFPVRRQLDLLRAAASSWRVSPLKQTRRNGEEPSHARNPIARLLASAVGK